MQIKWVSWPIWQQQDINMKEKIITRERPQARNTKKGLKRIEILRDAIAQIRAEKYNITPGTYVAFDGDTDKDDQLEAIASACEMLEPGSSKKEKAADIINKLVTKTRPCDVCAKGALMISSIRKDPTLKLASIAEVAFTDGDVVEITDVFEQDNLNLMESYFEENTHHVDADTIENSGKSWDEVEKDIDKWSRKYKQPGDRLIAIFKNAIANDGVFKPWD